LIPKDIIQSINFHSTDNEQVLELMKLCNTIKTLNLNVGHDQLMRAILVLTDFNAQEMSQLIASKFNGDPRDILASANQKAPWLNYGNNFIKNEK